MARKTKIVTVQLDGRDKGKCYLLTEMPASQGEEWATRVFLALANAGVEIPEELKDAGMSGIAIIGLRSLGQLKFDDAKPLFDQMMWCIQMVPDASRPSIVRQLVEDDIEEISTRLFLRGEVFELHTGFSIAAAISNAAAAAAERLNTSDTSMSPLSSGQ